MKILTLIPLAFTLAACGGSETSNPFETLAQLDATPPVVVAPPVLQPTPPPVDPLVAQPVVAPPVVVQPIVEPPVVVQPIVEPPVQEPAVVEAPPEPQPESVTVVQSLLCAVLHEEGANTGWHRWNTARPVDLLSDGSVSDPSGSFRHWDSDGFTHYLNIYNERWEPEAGGGFIISTAGFSTNTTFCYYEIPQPRQTTYSCQSQAGFYEIALDVLADVTHIGGGQVQIHGTTYDAYISAENRFVLTNPAGEYCELSGGPAVTTF